ncbi:hypothetical protein A3A76_02635 [Candidatus Woesebacteria bacterium RIFCSPLOWO2_01_FULL_39_23]|uniref:Uncharacterized protein n=1 Tax=Candidatus Woesebacteria bacterium RIFCSPHIGHO2_01_FULL_40_22 TaxID=1802499 RepID=A0A1F7YJA7_9BACT|nr:MAG: hypothetical protein A2141_01390 [Candidatus Woesebacteria bacterium RBG_16_40_11]OGM27373.1 MAG: hypothetical protein A2628_01040 [Candidatus Woesebacteria bacterium RIFCSPHIGHO2_01_FULL_40_22]OGM37264.1 MAG: hypothetical protein A3E41_00250 [Candidatus Woesebacteria bacterium RIFCSPHIGHO2_12_FULL_38_9]OGM62545.1 MAG: hypothetical protein A3A76_02635 [Candidatus Woesebacteria bacterium RIFCSPLOWO2_01_FULL_39_23]
MKNLLQFILENLIDKDSFEIEEHIQENGFSELTAIIDPKNMGIVIGKEGKVIKAIRALLRVKATLEHSAFTLSVTEKS